MKTLLSLWSVVWLSAGLAQAQFIFDCACLAQQPGLHVTNCQATIPDLCAVATNCFRGTVVPPPPLPPYQCNQNPPAGTPVGPGNHSITVTIQVAGQAPIQCLVTFQVTAPITGPFSLQCAPNKTVNCDAQWAFDPPTVVNPCCPNAALPNGGATVSVASTTTNGVCPQVITRTWQAVDQCGQTATCSQTVTVVDTVPPTISCGPDQTVNCGQQWSFSTPTISDNCTAPADLVLSIVSTVSSGSCPEVVTRTWQVTDLCGNKAMCVETVTIQDLIAPTITCAPNKTVECGTQWSFDPPTATDNCSGSAGTPSVTIAVVSTVTNGTCPEIITRTWTATDACGNTSAPCSQTVTVADTTPPTLDCRCITNNAALPPIPLTVTNCTGTIPDLCQYALLCATDNCGPLTCAQTPPAGTVVGSGVHPITVTIYDCASNSASCVINFTVVAPPGGCTTNPCPPTLTGVLNTGTTNGNGGLLPTGAQEQVWVNVAAPGGPTPMVVVDTNQFPIFAGPWVQPTATSAWVSPSVNSQGPAGWYTNRVIYNAKCDRVCLIGRVASDDDGYFFVNGVQIANTGFTIWWNVNDCTNFVQGPNVIEYVVHNAGGPTGFRTELEFYEQCCCNTFTNVWNTGMDGTNALAPGTPDPNYVLVSAPPGGCTGPAQVLNPLTLPVPPWVANGPNSQWIGAGPTADCQEGVYHYRLCFYLPCTDGASIVGQWTADDNAAMFLNGQPTGITIPSPQNPNIPLYNWFPVSITNGFICGTNCLDFYVTNALIGVNPTGFRAELTNVFDDCCCPETKPLSTVYSGMDPAGGPLPIGAPDPQFTLTCAPPGVTVTTPVAVTPDPSWVPNGPNSQWIGVDPSNFAPPGVYCYEMRFTIPCPPGVPIKASLTGQWTADDWAAMHLNGQPTGHTVPSIQFPNVGFNGWHPINITSGFQSGLNTLTFYVTNAGGPTGLRLELTNSASCCDCTNTCAVSITCPPDIVRETCGNVAHIIYPLPTATSSCGAQVSVVCAPPSNSVLPLGTTTVTCTGTDPMGNSATCSFKVIVLPDSTPPVIDCACVQAAIPPRVNACSYTVPDLCQLRQCFSDNCTLPNQLTCTQSPPAGTVLPAGASYIITLTVTDAAGNVSAPCQIGVSVIAPIETRVWNTGGSGSQAANFTVIQTPGGPANIPAVLTQPATGFWLPNDANSSWVSFTPNSQNAAPGVYIYRLTFNIPCTNGASVVGRFMSDDAARIYLNGAQTPALSTSFSTWTPVNLTSGFITGMNTLDVYVTNAVIWTGIRTELTNTFNCCCPESIVLNCPRPQSAWVCVPNGVAPVPYTVTASSLCGPNVSVSVTCVPPSPGPFPVGTTIVNCTATDSLGNTTSCSFPVTVVRDIIPPTITCPGPITRVICANSVAVYYKVRARDDCSPTVSVVCVPPSGTIFNAGTTIVTCTATDACGNTASCSFPVKVINNQIWQLLPSGINDCYAQSGLEPNSPGACLITAYGAGFWKNYDVSTVNRKVGHTWNFPPTWNILGAQLATRARPPVGSCAGISDNDSFSLGLINCTTPAWLWSRYLGSGNASPGLINRQWCYASGTACDHAFNLNLAALPLTPSGTVSLLPHMNSADRLDLFFQDDTTVDFANLRILRCGPTHVVGGIGTEILNARIAYGPAVWCIIRDNPTTPTASAMFRIGEASGLRLPIEPIALADHPGSALSLGEPQDGVSVERLRAAMQDGDTVRVSLGELPPGVTHIDMEIEIDGEIVQSFQNIPVTSGQPLVDFPGTEPVVELATANGNEVLLSILSQEPDQPAVKQTLRVRYLRSSKVSEAEVHLNVAGVPEVGIQHPELQMTPGVMTVNDRSVARQQYLLTHGDGLSEVSGGHGVVSPLDLDGAEPFSFTASFPPTDEFRAVLASPFGTFGPVPANAELRSIMRGLVGGEEVDVDLARFVASPGGDSSFDFTWSSARVHPVNKIYKIVGPGGTARLVFPGGSNVVVNVAELPVMHGKLGGRTPCRRFTWPKPTTMRIAGQTYEGIELQVRIETDDYPVTALTGLRVAATGAEALTLPLIEVGPEQYRLASPELTPDGVWLRWTGFGGVLEEATDLLGPWAPTAGQFEQSQGEVVTPHDPATRAKFFRVHGE